MAVTDEIAVRIVAQVEGLVAGVEQAKTEISGFAASVNEIKESFTGVGEAFAAAFAVHQVAEFADKFAELGEKALNTAFVLGATVKESDQVTAAMRLLGVDADRAATTLLFLGRSVHSALVDESGRAAVGFRNLGISMAEIRENANSLTGMLTVLLEHVQKLAPAGLETGGALRDVLGRGLRELAPLLRSDTEEFEAALRAVTEHSQAMAANAGAMDNTAQKIHRLGIDVETFGIKIFRMFKDDI